MAWGEDYDAAQVQLATRIAPTGDTKAEDALEPARKNLSDAIAALNRSTPNIALAKQEIRAAQAKIASTVIRGVRLMGPGPRAFPFPPSPTPAPPGAIPSGSAPSGGTATTPSGGGVPAGGSSSGSVSN